MKGFGRVSIAESEGGGNKNCQIFIFTFMCVAVNIEGWLIL